MVEQGASAGDKGPGVLGPLDEAADVNDECCELRLELDAEDMELTRGDGLLDEYAWGAYARDRDGNRSWVYNGREASEL